MTPAQHQLLRHAILLQLEAAAPASLPLDTLAQGVALAGHDVSEKQLHAELAHLAEKGFLAESRAPLAPGLLRYRLAAPGRDYLQSQALA